MTKTTFNKVQVGDIIHITIEDCGAGNAIVLSKDETSMTIKADSNTFTCCYDCQSMGNSFMEVNESEIHEMQIIIKEDNNMTTVKENNQTTVKEETKMTTNNSLQEAKAILERINNNPKVQDEKYLDRDTLREVLEPFEFGFTRKTTRKQMVQCLVSYIKEQEDLLDEIAWENEPYDYPRVKEAIYKATILKANKNQQHNFISNWIFTSVVAEAVIGKPLKEVINGVVVENYKSFTEVERELIKKVRSRFLEEAQWSKVIKKVKYGDKMVDELRGYTIPAKSIVYGRHKWLGVACVYKFDQHTNTGINTIEYHVSLDGIKNTQTGVVTPLTDESYAKLDELCTFVR